MSVGTIEIYVLITFCIGRKAKGHAEAVNVVQPHSEPLLVLLQNMWW